MNFLSNNQTSYNSISITNNRNKETSNENEYFTFKQESLPEATSDKTEQNNETNIVNITNNNNNYYYNNKFFLEIPLTNNNDEQLSCNRIETFSFRANNADLNEPPLTSTSHLKTQHSQLQIKSSNVNNNKTQTITSALQSQRAKIKKGSFHKFIHNQLFPIDFNKLRKHAEHNKGIVMNNNDFSKIKNISFNELFKKTLYHNKCSKNKRCSSTGQNKFNKINAINNNKDNCVYSYCNRKEYNNSSMGSNKIIEYQKNKRDLYINNVVNNSSRGKFSFSSSLKCLSPSLLYKHNSSSAITKCKNSFNSSINNLTNNSNNNSIQLNSSNIHNTSIHNYSGINVGYTNANNNTISIGYNVKQNNLKSFTLFKKKSSMFNLIYPPNTNINSNTSLRKSNHSINKCSYLKSSSPNSFISNNHSTRKNSFHINTYRSLK